MAFLKKSLALRNMQICNAWFSAFLTTKPYEEVEKDFIEHITFLKEMGAKVVGISEQGHSIQGTDKPIFEAKYVMNDAEWDMLCTGINTDFFAGKFKNKRLCSFIAVLADSHLRDSGAVQNFRRGLQSL